MKPTSQPLAEPPLACRPEKALWFLPFVFTALALAIPVSIWSGARPLTPQDDVWAVVAFCAMPGLPALATAFTLLHCRIVADARGLTFYGWHPRRFVAWEAVEDFELRLPEAKQSNAVTPVAWLKSGGKWRRLSTILKPHEALREIIARHAKSARAQGWQLAETREDGVWPKVFGYRDVSGWRLVATYLGFTLTIFALEFLRAATYGLAPLLKSIALTWSGLSLWGRVGFVATPLVLFGSIPLTILAQYPAIVARRRYLDQIITATREGLCFRRGANETFTRWDEITSYHLEPLMGHFQPTRFVLETRRERFDWLSGISGGKSLQILIQERAHHSTTRKWRHLDGADEDVLGGAASFYRGGSVGVGPKIHHYRTRTARAFLLFGTAMMAAFPVVIYLQITTGRLANGQPAGPADIATGIGLFAVVGAATLLAALGYGFASVWCEGDGLHQRGVWGERLVRWNEAESFRTSGFGDTLKSRRATIRYASFIADASGLRDEIQHRSGLKLSNPTPDQVD